MKEQGTSKVKKDNWDVVCSELRKFGIKVSIDRKERLKQGIHSIIHELIKEIFDYDQKLMSF